MRRHAELCRQLCDLRGWEVSDTYIDNDIPATEPRPDYERLVRDLPTGRFDIVVAYEQSRLARDDLDWPKFRKAYIAAGLTMIEFVHGAAPTSAQRRVD